MSQHPRTWLFLRGLVREQRHWEDFPDVFARYFPEDRILHHDYAGNGNRYSENSATSVSRMVDDARRAMKRHNADPGESQGIHILALSLGSMVAVDWLSRYPQEIASAVLISTSIKGLSPFYHRLLPANYLTVLQSLLFAYDHKRNEQNNLDMVSSIVSRQPVERERVLRHWVKYADQYPVNAVNGLRQLIAASRFRLTSCVQKPDVPILLLRGMQDHMVSPLCSQRFAEHWHLPLRSHDRAGHDIPLDDPEWVCQTVSEWMAEL